MGTPCIALDEEGTLWRERARAVLQATLLGMYKRIPSHHQCVMGLDAQEAGGSLVHMEGAQVSKT